jgi:hypothetical protein
VVSTTQPRDELRLKGFHNSPLLSILFDLHIPCKAHAVLLALAFLFLLFLLYFLTITVWLLWEGDFLEVLGGLHMAFTRSDGAYLTGGNRRIRFHKHCIF